MSHPQPIAFAESCYQGVAKVKKTRTGVCTNSQIPARMAARARSLCRARFGCDRYVGRPFLLVAVRHTGQFAGFLTWAGWL
jgi:hypothetical protein